jgi:hypothetical protein
MTLATLGLLAALLAAEPPAQPDVLAARKMVEKSLATLGVVRTLPPYGNSQPGR